MIANDEYQKKWFQNDDKRAIHHIVSTSHWHSFLICPCSFWDLSRCVTGRGLRIVKGRHPDYWRVSSTLPHPITWSIFSNFLALRPVYAIGFQCWTDNRLDASEKPLFLYCWHLPMLSFLFGKNLRGDCLFELFQVAPSQKGFSRIVNMSPLIDPV